ncbi:hypothetical protein NDU88_000444 [Pleurodeles waltl]|uniref:Uncharacterized protein n=1 Tax=Pleurodeles waltl TaxID=8319 RepID=A0AAV7P1C8_PLEWA|nr:hypothetical protein NDU88_000444 [Pleurodeles waltl]
MQTFSQVPDTQICPCVFTDGLDLIPGGMDERVHFFALRQWTIRGFSRFPVCHAPLIHHFVTVVVTRSLRVVIVLSEEHLVTCLSGRWSAVLVGARDGRCHEEEDR